MRKLQISSGNNTILMASQANNGNKKKEGRNRSRTRRKVRMIGGQEEWEVKMKKGKR
jgi:hypothetical protein